MSDRDTPLTEQQPVLLVASPQELDRLKKAGDWRKIPRVIWRVAYWNLVPPPAAFCPPQPIPWPHLTPEKAARQYQFDMGHPQDGTAYIQNPAVADHYLLPALANERFVQEKVAAFVEISEALGARHLTLKSGSVKTTDGKAEASLETVAAQAGLGVSFGANHSVDRQVLMEFAEPEEGPHMPEGLSGWLVQDPILRSYVSTRLRQQRLLKAAVSLILSESVELAAELTATLPELGIKTGGQYRAVQESTWAFEVEFWPGKKP